MIKTVDFIPRIKAEALSSCNGLAIVSITEPEVNPAVLAIPEDRVLRLVFHDVDPGNEAGDRWVLFEEHHGSRVIEFVRRLHAAPEPFDLICHCRAGISRSAAVALFAAEVTGCAFPRKPFSGLANEHVLSVLRKMTGQALARPRALPKREQFSVSIARNFETGQAEVTVENQQGGESTVKAGPMLQVPELAAAGIQQVWGIQNPPPSYHVTDWGSLAPGK